MYERPERAIAYAKGVATSGQVFEDTVARWVRLLSAKKGVRWAVYHHDACEFIAIIFALWQLDRTACIPGDNRPGTVRRLQSMVDGFAGDFAVDSAINPDDHQSQMVPEMTWKIIDVDFAGLEIYTSGSTGEPEAISKTIRQLELEVQSLESNWPDSPETIVLATVSHQHLYGMTFRLFWPLSTGRAFEREVIEYTEDIFYLALHYESFSLVSSPSHLARMNTSVNWEELKGRCRYILSSAAPLQREDSINVGKLLCVSVREIYGSSETGALAWRIQQDSTQDALWQALPQVQLSVSEDGNLIARAPYLGDEDEFISSDRVKYTPAGQFKLIGRVDRVVKIEGKRVSLDAIEKLILEHDWIKNARALTIQRRRIETAVVVELNDLGDQVRSKEGAKVITGELKNRLKDHFEAVVVPRRWRIVPEMPYNQQGKLPLEALQQLFKPVSVKWPEISTPEWLDDQVSIQCYMPAELVYFDGHFPEAPILPGIAQVHWVEAYGRRYLGVKGVFDCLEVIKFQQIISPGMTVNLKIRFDVKKAKLHFLYESAQGVHSSGRICFRS